jgi:hypothetical protein
VLLIVIVSDAEVVPMSNEYVAPGQPVPPPPQLVSVSEPIVSAFAAVLKLKHASASTAATTRYFFINESS